MFCLNAYLTPSQINIYALDIRLYISQIVGIVKLDTAYLVWLSKISGHNEKKKKAFNY